ncbi:hypothetical protein ACFW04_003635 [Cataglyphis niger]
MSGRAEERGTTIYSNSKISTIRTTLSSTISFGNLTNGVSSTKSMSSSGTTTADKTTTSFGNLTNGVSSTKSISSSETTTADKTTTVPTTQMPTYFTRLPTILSTPFTTQKCMTSTQLSSTEMISSDSTITNAKEITDTSKTMPITVTTVLPTISTTLVTNGTTSESKIPSDITSIIPSIVTSDATSATTMETNRTTIITTTINDTITETTLAKESSTISTPMPTPKCTNMTMHYMIYIALEFDYIVRDIETEVACIFTNMMIRINLRYAVKSFQISNATLTVPTNAKTTSICDEKIAKITLNWEESIESRVDGNNKEDRIIFNYAYNKTKFFHDFISINVHLDGNNFPRAQRTDCIAETNVNIGAIVGAVFIGIVLILILIICKCRLRKANSVKDSKNIANYFLSCKKIFLNKWRSHIFKIS